MFDLLQQRNTDLMVIEENNLVDIRGLAKIRVKTEAQAMKWFNEGEKHRSYRQHLLNQVTHNSKLVLAAPCLLNHKVAILHG
jgi:hypothetical protein